MTNKAKASAIKKGWQTLGGPTAGTVAAVAVANTNTPTAFIGTKVGVFRAALADGKWAGGWQRLANAPIGVLAVATSPHYERDHMVIAANDQGLFFSRDGGDTWHTAHMPYAESIVLSVCFSPNFADDGIVFAGTLGDGVWQSDTRGEKWHARNFGLLDSNVYALAVSPAFAHDETLYAGTDTAVYCSYNGARAWKQVDFPEASLPVLSLALSPTFAHNHMLYAGTENDGLYASADGGDTWQKMALAANSVNAVMSLRSTELLAATDAGVFHSADCGQQWRQVLAAHDVLCLSAARDIALAGLVDAGAHMSANNSFINKWKPVTLPPIRAISSFEVSPAFERDGVAFMYGAQEGLWRTDDGGTTWQPLDEAMPSNDARAIGVSPSFEQDRRVVAVGADGVFAGGDSAAHWQAVSTEGAHLLAFAPDGQCCAVAFDDGLRLFDCDFDNAAHLAGPWDEAGRIAAVALQANGALAVATLDEVSHALNVWLGTPERMRHVLSQTCRAGTVVNLWLTEAQCVVSASDSVYAIDVYSANVRHASIGNAAPNEDILALTGFDESKNRVWVVCTSKHLLTSANLIDWHSVHDFGLDTALACRLSRAFGVNRMAYVLLLGGTLGRVSI